MSKRSPATRPMGFVNRGQQRAAGGRERENHPGEGGLGRGGAVACERLLKNADDHNQACVCGYARICKKM